MCGICGIVNFDQRPVPEQGIKGMMRAMKHRGPDDEGVFTENSVGLGFVRLSIIDLSSAGHQPMVSADQRYVVVFNGEIYNYIEIREELKKKGYRFYSGTDTEVLLNAYIEWGESCLDKFNGMWAFVIYDRITKSLFGARDRYGVKPFYYFHDGSRFIFASDIPPIITQLNSSPDPDIQVIFNYLNFGRTDYSENTFFQRIKKLQHGHCIRISGHHIEFKKWYDLKEKKTEPLSQKGEFLALLESSINFRLRSDVPVGVCLSGGLDSSSIVTILKQTLPTENINTFSAVYGIKHRADESDFINEIIQDLPHAYQIKPSLKSFIKDMPRLFQAHSEPFSTSAIYAQFKVMELARGNVTVLLDGQGADEYLCGYHYFYGYYFKELMRTMRFLKLAREVGKGYRNTKSLLGFKSFLYFSLPTPVKEFLLTRQNKFLNSDYFKNNIRNNPIVEELHSGNNIRQSVINHFEFKLEHLLKWEDRNSMFFSLESRVPFLDYRLVEKALNTSVSRLINDGWTKKILRDEMRGLLPEKIRMRKDKVGFATPEEIWLRDKDFIPLFENIFKNNNAVFQFIDPDKLRYILQEHIAAKSNHSSVLWRVFNLNEWMAKNYN